MISSRLMVFSPAPDRSGAPIALLRQMQWLADREVVDPIFVFRGGGELQGEFVRVGRTVVVPDLAERVALRASRAVGQERSFRAVQRRALRTWIGTSCRRSAVDAVYANTVRVWDVVLAAADLGIPIIWHVHEGPRSIRNHVPEAAMRQAVKVVARFIAVSGSVARALEGYGADPGRISVVPGMVSVPPRRADAEAAAAVRRRLGVEAGAPLIVGAGKPSETKGADLFVQLAVRLQRACPTSRMCWVGMRQEPASRCMRDDVEAAGLSGRVDLVDELPDVSAYLAAAQVFISCAREDAMPLSVLESAAQGVPFVCFEGAGGTAELAAAGAGMAVRYLDVEAMASAVEQVLSDPGLAQMLSERARSFVVEHCSAAVVGSRAAAAVDAAVTA